MGVFARPAPVATKDTTKGYGDPGGRFFATSTTDSLCQIRRNPKAKPNWGEVLQEIRSRLGRFLKQLARSSVPVDWSIDRQSMAKSRVDDGLRCVEKSK